MIIVIVKILIGLIVAIPFIFGVMRVVRYQQTKIQTKNGIQESKMITLGGISQFIQIRGEDKENPVVIFLHGGPGNPISYIASYMQKGLEDDFTFVHWDQRGSGKSYYANPEAEVTINLLLSDLDELVDYLRERFHQDKIVVMAHSWGTVLGARYSKVHPEKLLSYIGIGQLVDIDKADIIAKDEAIKRATEQGNEMDVQMINEYIKNYKSEGDYEHIDWHNKKLLQELTGKYLSPKDGMSSLQMIYTGLLDPDMDLKEFCWSLTVNNMERLAQKEYNLQKYMFDLFHLEDLGMQYEIPVYFISGDSDWATPYVLVQEFYEKLIAPKKQFFLIERAGHATYMDNQKGFQEAMEHIKEDLLCQK